MVYTPVNRRYLRVLTVTYRLGNAIGNTRLTREANTWPICRSLISTPTPDGGSPTTPTAESARREIAAAEAEADARSQREALATEAENSRAEMGRRESAIRDREEAQLRRDGEQESQEQDLSHRERLLREAGVVLPE